MKSFGPKNFIKSALDKSQALSQSLPKPEPPKNVKPPASIKLLRGAQRVLSGHGLGLGRL